MLNLLLLFVKLAFFKASPADVPSGRSTLVVAVVSLVLANVAVTYTWYGFGNGLLAASLEVLLNAAFLSACLSFCQRRARFEQSMAAICGISAVMALCAWPWALEVGANSSEPSTWVAWGHLVLLMWSLLIWARVLRLACDFDRVSAALLSLGFFFGSAAVMAVALPPVV